MPCIQLIEGPVGAGKSAFALQLGFDRVVFLQMMHRVVLSVGGTGGVAGLVGAG